jgi:hypothetical protein
MGTAKLLYLLALRGGPGQSPTADLRVRSALLYATELPGHVWLVYREDACATVVKLKDG